MLKMLMRVLVAALAGVGAVTLAAGAWLVARGISAKDQPRAIEVAAARRLRAFAIPRAARDMRNPVAPTAAVVREGMSHYADHCAGCHGNDGSGETEMGRGLY